MEQEEKTTINAENYGEVLALVNNLELVKFEEDGGYQGEYIAILKDNEKLYYFIGSYGSCSGCDWLQDISDYNMDSDNKYIIPYKEALDYCQDNKPAYIVPINKPLEFKNKGEYEGWELV